jgi:hypothetical protein
MARNRVRIPPPDDIVRGCLDQLRRGTVSAVGVLADHLEEQKHPLAKKIRKEWNRYVNNVTYWSDPAIDVSRRRYTRWELLALIAQNLRYRVRVMFRLVWKRLPLSTYIRRT